MVNVPFIADPGAGFFPPGDHDVTDTIVIPRVRDTPSMTFLGTSDARWPTAEIHPAGMVWGASHNLTALRFANTVTDALIKTEGYGEGTLESFWNADPDRGMFLPTVRDLTILGSSGQLTDPPTFRADGIQVEAINAVLENILLHDIPGVGVRLSRPGAGGPNASAHAFLETELHWRVQNILIHNAQGGFHVESNGGDSWLSNIHAWEIYGDGYVNAAPGTHITRSHIYGCFGTNVAAARFTGPEGRAVGVYWESAPYGVYIDLGAYGTMITNLFSGKCWKRNVYIGSNGCTFNHVGINVRAEDATWTDIAGIEFGADWVVHNSVNGGFINPEGTSTAIIMRGQRNMVNDMIIGAGPSATALLVPGGASARGCRVDITGANGTTGLIDLSAADWNTVDGMGNEIRVTWNSAPTNRIIYPGGGSTYNLTTGHKIIWNGTTLS